MALLIVRDLEAGSTLTPKLLQRLFGLSSSEARLADAIARGLSLRDAAAERGIAYETARSQLKSVFMKTNCGRQSELVALIAGVGL